MNEEPISTDQPINHEEPKNSAASFLFDALEMFAWSLFAVFILFTFAVRLCRVDGSSMENTLYEGENLLVSSIGYVPRQDDIIVFHLTVEDSEKNLEKTLVKRVIATGGQTLQINFNNGEIHVDGILYEDSHAVLKDYFNTETGVYYPDHTDHHYDPETRILSLTVPEHTLFVLGDNRNWSKDSRNSDIAFVDERCVLGKVILRLSPFTVFS